MTFFKIRNDRRSDRRSVISDRDRDRDRDRDCKNSDGDLIAITDFSDRLYTPGKYPQLHELTSGL